MIWVSIRFHDVKAVHVIFFKTVWVKLTSQGWPLDRLLCFKFSFQDLHEGISWGQMFFPYIRAAAAKSLQSCLTLCDRIDGSPPGSPVPGILQARALEWVAISFSNAWKWRVKVKSLSRVRLLATPWTPGSCVHGIFQARVLEWGATAFLGQHKSDCSDLKLSSTAWLNHLMVPNVNSSFS